MELRIHRHIKPLIGDIDAAIQQLGLSLSNLNHFSAMVDYYTASKLRRFDNMPRSLYLLCYLHLKYRQVIEHLADAFIHHCRKLQQEAKRYADDTAYQERKETVANIGKGATLLRFFIAESIDDSVRFGEIRQRAAGVMLPKQIESLCRYLTRQKQSQAFYIGEYYDQQAELIEKILRPIFLTLKFQSSKSTHALGVQIEQSQSDLDVYGSIREADRGLIRPRHLPYVVPGGSINTAPEQLMRSLQKELTTKLNQVGDRIQKGDKRNVVLRARTGKTQ